MGRVVDKEIYQLNIFDNLVSSAEVAEKAIESLTEQSQELGKVLEESSKTIIVEKSDVKTLQQLNKLQKEMAEQRKELTEANKELNKLRDKSISQEAKITKGNKVRISQAKTDIKLTSDLETEIARLTTAKNLLIKKEQEAAKAAQQGNVMSSKAAGLTRAEEKELSELIVRLEDARLKRNDERKELRESLKERQGVLSLYQRESKRLNDLRKRFKNLILIEGKSTKATDKLEKEIKELDTTLKGVDERAGQFQRNVGNYPKTVKSATDSLLKFAVAALSVKAAADGLTSSLDANEEGSEDLRKATGFLEGAWNNVKNSFGSFAATAIDGFKNLSFSGKGFLENVGSIVDIINESDKAFNKTIKNTIDLASEQADAEQKVIDFEKSIRDLNLELEKQESIIAIQTQRATDITVAFDKQQEAAAKAGEAQERRADILIQIAQAELDIIDAQLKARGEGAQNIKLLDEQNAALVKLREAESGLTVAIRENDELQRNIRRKRFEREIAFSKDIAEAQLESNSRIIEDDNETLERRIEVLEKTRKLTLDSFKEQQQIFDEFTGVRLDLTELINLDAKALADRLKELDINVFTSEKLRQLLKERVGLTQDLKDLEEGINAEIEERFENEQQAAADLKQFRLDLRAELAEDIDDRVQKEKDAAEFRFGVLLNNEKLLADERTLLEEQLQAELTEIERKGIEDRRKLEEKAAKQRAKELKEQAQQAVRFLNLVTANTKKELDAQNRLRLDDIDRQIEDNQAALERQQELFDRGAENQLSAERRRQAELAIARREELERQRQQEEAIELTQTFLRSLNAFLSNADTESEVAAAPAKALAQTVIARATARTIAGAFEKGGLVEGDEQLIRVNEKGQEFVIDAPTTKKLGLDKAGSTMQDFNKMLATSVPVDAIAEKSQYLDLREEIKDFKEVLKNRPVPSFIFDKHGNMIEEKRYDWGTDRIKHKRSSHRV